MFAYSSLVIKVVSAHLGIMGDITNKSVLTDISRLTIAKAHLADSISVARNISDLTQPLGVRQFELDHQ